MLWECQSFEIEFIGGTNVLKVFLDVTLTISMFQIYSEIITN